MRLEDLQAAARELPQHQPTEAQRSALRASLVEAARAERPAPRRPRVGRAVALGGALAAAAGLAIWWSWSRSTDSDEGASAAAEVGPRRATIQSSSGAHFEHTRVFGPAAGDAPALADEVVRLRQGRVAVAVEHLGDGERFRVVTGDAEVEVRGTSFDVIVEDDQLVEVVVRTGLVEVRPDGREMIALGPGERWRADQHPVRTAALAPAPTADQPAPVDQPATAAPAPGPTDPPGVPALPPAAAEPSSSGRAPAAGGVEHRGPGLVQGTRADKLREPKALPVPEGPPEDQTAPRDDAAATEEEAPRPALPPAPTASEVAFGRGFRALRRGDYGEASEQFEAAIASGPGSPLVDDARYWRAVALARSGRTGSAREALDEFLRLHPLSPRAGEASVMLGWMLLEAGDSTGAFRRFKAAAGDRDPAVRASAEKGLARVRRR